MAKFLLIAVMTGFFSVSGWAGAYEELNPEQQNQVQRGSQIIVTTPISGHPWPQITVYQRVDAGIDEAAAVFWDFPRYKEYFGNVILRSVPHSKRPQPNVVFVDFEIDVPFPMSDDAYTMKNTLTVISSGFSVDWAMVGESKHSKSAVGSARFETLGTGTLIAYRNFVVPKSSLAGIGKVRERAVQEVRDTVTALVKNIQTIRVQKPTLLQQQLQELRRSLLP